MLIAPFSQIQVSGFIELIAALISFMHWIALLFVALIHQLRVARTFLHNYFTYLQLFLIYPSFLHINRLNSITQKMVCLAPIIFNYVIYSYIQRNYLLPAINPYAKRYKLTNYFINLSDLIAIISIAIFDEMIQTPILVLTFLFQLLDSIFKNPYPRSVNIYYCVSHSILFMGSLFKLINNDQKQYLLISLLFFPLVAAVMKKSLKLFYDHQTSDKQLLINFVDEYQCSNRFIQLQVLSDLRNISHCKHNVTNFTLFEQLQHYIETLFIKIVEDLSPIDKYLDEDLHIYKVLFLYQRLPNLAFLHIKKYQCNSIKQSFYFQILERACNKTHKSINVELQSICKSQQLFDESTPKLMEILQYKIQYYEQLVIGFANIEQLATLSEVLSSRVLELKNKIFKQLGLHIFTIQKEIQNLNVLDLRLLSKLFGAILNDYHITYQIEQRIEEILSQERNIQTRKIQNQTLVNEEVIFVSISMLKNLGTITKNKSKLQKFLQFPDEDIQISHLNQVLPDYLQGKHDRFLTKFIENGDSKFFANSKDVFPIYYNGFSFNVTMQLLISQNYADDYVIIAALKKVNENSDFILFDDTGRILGLSESVQQILILPPEDQFDKRLQKSYIYFWFRDLLYIINDQQEQLHQTHIGMQTVIIQPIVDISSVIRNHEAFRRSHFLTQTNTIHTEQDSNMKVQCFEKNYIEQTSDFVNDLKMNQGSPCYQITFDVHFLKLQDIHPFFMLQISEYQQKEPKTSCLGTLSAYSSIYKSRQMDTDKWVLNDDTDMDEIHQELIINQTIINKLLLRYNDNEMMKSNKESNLISPRSNREILIVKEDDDSEYIRESNILKSSSQRQIKEEIEQNDFMHEKQSKSSVTSDKTQNSIYNLMRKLQHTQQFQTSIVKAMFITTLLSVLLIIIVSIELVENRTNVNILEYEIPLVRIPQRFNRLYCTFVTIGQLELQYKLLNQSYGEYYDYRVGNESAMKRIEIETIMIDIKNEFSTLQQNDQIPYMEIRFINEFVYQVMNISMIEFDTMVNEFTAQINELLQSDTDIDRIQILLQFLKGNLIKQLDMTISLVNQIETKFFNTISYCETEWFIFLLVQLWVIIIMLVLQLKQWQSPYKYMQSVLLLISKVNERDIEFQGSRIYCLIDKLQRNPGQGKNINYFKEFFWYSKRKVQSFSQKLSEIQKTKQSFSHSKVKQSSRIQETAFSIINIKVILICLWLLLSGYVLSGFVILKTSMDGSQPEMQLVMEYVKFKQDLDGTMIICQLLKNQQILIDETMASGIFSRNPELSTKDKYFKTLYNELLAEFKPLITDMNEIYSSIYNEVISSKKISTTNKDLLLSLYEDNLCDLIPSVLPFCDYENGRFTYFPTFPAAPTTLNNKAIYKYGINGLYQQIMNIFNTHYTLEQNGIKDTNITGVREFLQSSDYILVILPYFFDLSYAILQFYYTIIQAALDILEYNYQMSFYYYVITGFGCLTILCSTIVIRAITLQNRVRLIRQAMIMIPHESLQDSTIMSAIKNIDRSL